MASGGKSMVKKFSVPYFHISLKYFTPFIFGIAVYLFFVDYHLWSVVLILIGIIILTTRYVTEISLKDSVCRDYLSFLGMNLQEEIKKFKSVDRIVITKGDYSQMQNTRYRSRQLDWVDYTGTVVFDNGSTINLLTKNEKEDLIKGIKEFAAFLDVKVEDRTTQQHYWIDLTKV